MPKQSPERSKRDLDEWDAEIEVEFQRAVRRTKVSSQPKANNASAGKGWRRHSTTVPREWELRLQRATRISTFRLALELLYRRWRAEQDKFGRAGQPVIVSREVIRAAGLSARSAANALSQLERLGLVDVVRAQGRAHRASLLHVSARPQR